MKTITYNQDALTDAVRIVYGAIDLTKLDEVYRTLDAAERKGHMDGFEVGYDQGRLDGWNAGYPAGEDVGKHSNDEATFEAGYKNGYDAGVDVGYGSGNEVSEEILEQEWDRGYEQARRDLGECPTLDVCFDTDFDKDLYDYILSLSDDDGC